MSRTERRFQRQFEALSRLVPRLRKPLKLLRHDRWRIVRLPAAFLLIIGGLVSILPFLGLWMLPFGLLLLAIDVPALRGPIAALIIRLRRWGSVLGRRWRARR